MTTVDLTDTEVEIIRRARLSPSAYAAEEKAKADARLDRYLASLTADRRKAWYAEQDRLASLTGGERAFERLIRIRIRTTNALQREPYSNILGRLGNHPNLASVVLEEAEEFSLLLAAEEGASTSGGGFIVWLRNLLGL